MRDTSNPGKPGLEAEPATPAGPAPVDAGNVDAKAPEAPPLSAEEQMALYEEDLKENDWGHQPC